MMRWEWRRWWGVVWRRWCLDVGKCRLLQVSRFDSWNQEMNEELQLSEWKGRCGADLKAKIINSFFLSAIARIIDMWSFFWPESNEQIDNWLKMKSEDDTHKTHSTSSRKYSLSNPLHTLFHGYLFFQNTNDSPTLLLLSPVLSPQSIFHIQLFYIILNNNFCIAIPV